MQEITLRELCMKYRVPRRAVQGYEKAGLVEASGKNKMGYLLYDVEAQERIERIRMLQNIGFSIREIKEIIDLPQEQIVPILERQIEKLNKEKTYIDEQIEVTNKLIHK